MRFFTLFTLLGLARGAVITFFRDSSCTTPATDLPALTVFTNQFTAFNNTPDSKNPSWDYTFSTYDPVPTLLKLTTCSSSSFVFPPFVGGCSSFPVEPTYNPKLSVAPNTCVSVSAANAQCYSLTCEI